MRLVTFDTHRVVASGPTSLVLRPTPIERAFVPLVGALGIALTGLGAVRVTTGAAATAVWLPLVGGLLALGVTTLLRRPATGTVIDGVRREIRHVDGIDRLPFDEIVAVRCLPVRLADDEVSWSVHRVDLDCRDGSRPTLCTHADGRRAHAGAERVAELVGVPLLDAPFTCVPPRDD